MANRAFDFLPPLLAGFCTTVLVVAPFPAHAAAGAKPAVEIVRPGDHDMACPALAAEINDLGQPQAAAEAKPKKHGGFGLLRALGSAVPLVGGLGGGMGAALVSNVAGTATQLAAGNQVGGQLDDARTMAREALVGGSPAQQRKTRLMTIFEEKRC